MRITVVALGNCRRIYACSRAAVVAKQSNNESHMPVRWRDLELRDCRRLKWLQLKDCRWKQRMPQARLCVSTEDNCIARLW